MIQQKNELLSACECLQKFTRAYLVNGKKSEECQIYWRKFTGHIQKLQTLMGEE